MKKPIADSIDKDLEDLYRSATDFTEKSRAMELRIKYANIKSRSFGPAGTPAGLLDDDE